VFRPEHPFLSFQDAYVGQVPIPLGVVEAKTDHEQIRDFETHIVGDCLHLTARGLVQKRADAEGTRFTLGQELLQVVEGAARIHDVFDDQNVTILYVVLKVHQQSHMPRALRRITVAGDRDHFNDGGYGDPANQVGQEDKAPSQHTHQNQ